MVLDKGCQSPSTHFGRKKRGEEGGLLSESRTFLCVGENYSYSP